MSSKTLLAKKIYDRGATFWKLNINIINHITTVTTKIIHIDLYGYLITSLIEPPALKEYLIYVYATYNRRNTNNSIPIPDDDRVKKPPNLKIEGIKILAMVINIIISDALISFAVVFGKNI